MPGAAIVDERLGVDEGDTITLSGMEFEVVAERSGGTYFAGVPTVVAALSDVQRLGFDGRPFATAIVTEGNVDAAPPKGFSVLTNGDVKQDLNRPVAQAKQTIGLIRWLLWAVAAGIVGAILYLSTLERTADFAVFKAIGVSTASLVRGLVGQAIVLTLAAVAVADRARAASRSAVGDEGRGACACVRGAAGGRGSCRCRREPRCAEARPEDRPCARFCRLTWISSGATWSSSTGVATM